MSVQVTLSVTVTLFKMVRIKYVKKNKIKGNIKQKIFIAEGIKNSEQKVCYNNTKNCDFKYCNILESNSLVFI